MGNKEEKLTRAKKLPCGFMLFTKLRLLEYFVLTLFFFSIFSKMSKIRLFGNYDN